MCVCASYEGDGLIYERALGSCLNIHIDSKHAAVSNSIQNTYVNTFTIYIYIQIFGHGKQAGMVLAQGCISRTHTRSVELY